MKRLWLAALGVAATLAVGLVPGLAGAQARYSVKTTGDVVQLRDNTSDMTVSVLTPVHNAYEIVIKGTNVIRMSITSVDALRARPNLNGVPLLWPFANRLDETAFYANGQKYNFDMDLGNVRGPIPIHGYLSGTNAWQVVEAKADANGAWITSKLEFSKIPEYMQQFPFAHTLTMTYRLSGGSLEVRTKIDNLSTKPMPVTIGFHPYYSLTDSNRDQWTLSVPAQTHWKLDSRSIPTGETEPASAFWGQADLTAIPLGTKRVDDVFTDLPRDAQGKATVSIQGVKQKIAITFGEKFKTAVMFATPIAPLPAPGAAPAAPRPPAAPAAPPPPPVSVGPPIPLSATKGEPAPRERGFVAIEPMAGITNAMNAAQKGTYKDLQSVAPGGSWQESFWITPSGY